MDESRENKIALDPELVIAELRNQLSDAMFENVKLKAFIAQSQRPAAENPNA